MTKLHRALAILAMCLTMASAATAQTAAGLFHPRSERPRTAATFNGSHLVRAGWNECPRKFIQLIRHWFGVDV